MNAEMQIRIPLGTTLKRVGFDQFFASRIE
jgi:hypothetical protein